MLNSPSLKPRKCNSSCFEALFSLSKAPFTWTDLHTYLLAYMLTLQMWLCERIYSRMQNLHLVRTKCTFFVCIYANVTHMQILSCECEVKFAYIYIYQLCHINVDLTLFQLCVSARIIVSDWPVYHFYCYWNFQLLQIYRHF